MNLSKRVFEFAILIGLIAIIFIYSFAFDDFSETELVRLSYLWFSACIFGTHGLISYELKTIVDAGQAETAKEALKVRSENKDRSIFSKVSSLMLWSFLLITAATDRLRPVLSAVLATIIWILLLAFFFEAIFPGL